MKNTIKLSAVLIVKNEALLISKCLQSLDFADEIVVIDTGSTDTTAQIAQKFGARVISYTTGASFADWRNKGLKEAKGEWIFYIDADERVPSSLRKELLSVVNESTFDWYVIPRSNFIFKREFRHGGWWPDYVKRVFRRDALKMWSGDLHEEPVTEGSMGYLKNYLVHDKHETLAEMVEKTNKWSAIEGKLMFDANHPPMNIPRFITGMGREFWYRMIVKQGFRDGKEGVIMTMYQVFSRFCSYAKLWELQMKAGQVK